jgi:CheY-like chemotaxis protein
MHIDDSDDDALLLSRALRHSAHPTIFRWFPSAREAASYLENPPPDGIPDLIFCDLRMPGMSGHDFIRWLRNSKMPTLPVVVLSSSELIEDIRLAYQLGANSFLIKPVSVPEIREMVNNAVEFWSQCILTTRAPNSSPSSEN